MTTITASPAEQTPIQMNVLVVDDDKSTREIIRMMLISEGYAVQMAANGTEALRTIQFHDFDLVITDLFMPEKDGIETIREIRSKCSEMKIIAISGGAGGVGQECLAITKYLGASATLKKPFDRETLLETIRTVLSTDGQIS